MNYYEKVEELLKTHKHPCDKEIPPGFYRRVKWELYNPEGKKIQPGNGEEWETEIISLSTRLYDKNPFGYISETIPDPSIDPEDPNSGCKNWCSKIGYCFSSKAELEEYVKSIGSKMVNGTWYGADLSKSHLFKTSIEHDMYRIENIGGIWTQEGPQIDARTMLRVESDYSVHLNFNCLERYRCAYMKHYEDKPCAFVGLHLNLDVDTSIPGIPESEPPLIGGLPNELVRRMRSAGCIPFAASFPYNALSSDITDAWNSTRNTFKLYWDMLPGLPQKAAGYAGTMYDNVSISMEELGNATLAMGQYATQQAWMVFKEIISQALNIVGGGWDLLKSFLPSISILGVSIDIEDLCMSGNAIDSLKSAFSGMNPEKVISAVYSAMGSAYDYSVEYVKCGARDLVDTLTDFYDWALVQLQMGGVALCKMLADLAQIWAMPPEVPNPVWAAVTAVKKIFGSIEPLDMIMSGNFPGFTAADIYTQIQKKIKELIDLTYDNISRLKDEYQNVLSEIKNIDTELKQKMIEFKQYMKGMYEMISDEATKARESAIEQLSKAKDKLIENKNKINSLINGEQSNVSDILDLALKYFKDLPIVSQIESLLSLLGASLDSIVQVYENSVTGAKSLYHEYTSGSRSAKDICKTIYNQVSTLTLSKVTQWINKLLSIFGLSISFPEISICVPYMKYEDPNG